MSNKAKGLLFGGVASLGGVLLWVILYVSIDVILAWAAALMTYLFFKVYKKYNPEKITLDVYIIVVVTLVFDIMLAEFLSLYIYLKMESIPLSIVLSDPEAYKGIGIDLLFGFLFGIVFFFLDVFNFKKQEKAALLKREEEDTIKDNSYKISDISEIFEDDKIDNNVTVENSDSQKQITNEEDKDK